MNNRDRVYKCDRCGFRFMKYSPASVSKCIKCSYMAVDVDGYVADYISEKKKRWYLSGDGSERHLNEIKNRIITTIDGKDRVATMDDSGKYYMDLEETDIKVDGDLGKSTSLKS